MSLKRPAKEQPKNFEFSSSSLEAAKTIISRYPKNKQQSAVMALLYIAQRQNNNWIPLAAMKYIAKFLDMPYIKLQRGIVLTLFVLKEQKRVSR